MKVKSLYKFVSGSDAVCSIAAGSIRFTPISELNDPSELSPAMHTADVLASLSRLRDEGYMETDMQFLHQQSELLQLLAPTFSALPAPRSIAEANRIIQSRSYDAINDLERMLVALAGEIAPKVGIFCVTNRIDSLPMWAHYASNATGFVVEFDDLFKEFKGDNTGVLSQVRAVNYKREVCGITFEPRSHENLFFSKYQDWSYEQEFRVVMPLSKCQIQTVNNNDIYLFNIPKSYIKRIIVGWNVKDAVVEKIIYEVNKTNEANEIDLPIKVMKARFEKGKVVINPDA